MQEKINQLENVKNLRQILKDTCRTSKISPLVLGGLTIKNMRTIWARILKHYSHNPQKAKRQWFQNQLKFFHWILIIEACLLDLSLQKFNDSNWITLQSYFSPKTVEFLKYEAAKLINSSQPYLPRRWTEAQRILLREILEDESLMNDWSEVSRKFFLASQGKIYRSSKQCKEQWFNHLDSSKKHGQWTPEEDTAILQYVIAHGHKWIQLSRQLMPSRTEHMIKNRFKSYLQPYSKKGKYYNERKIIRKLLRKLKNQNLKGQKTSTSSIQQLNVIKDICVSIQHSNPTINLEQNYQKPETQSTALIIPQLHGNAANKVFNNSFSSYPSYFTGINQNGIMACYPIAADVGIHTYSMAVVFPQLYFDYGFTMM